MPSCGICKNRIHVDATGVLAYRCRICGKMYCKDHFILPRGICALCTGLSNEQVLRKKNRKTISLIRKVS